MADPTPPPGSSGGMPRWAKVQGVLVVLFVLVVLGMVADVPGLLLGVGGHGAPAGGH